MNKQKDMKREKAIEESWELLCCKSTLSEEEISSRMNDEEWKNTCVDMAECKLAMIESEAYKKNNVDEIWLHFKEHSQRKHRKQIFAWTASGIGLAAAICFSVFWLRWSITEVQDETLFFCASQESHNITLQINNGQAMTLEEAVQKGHLEETATIWKSKPNNSPSDSLSSNMAEPIWHSISIPRGTDFSLVLADGTKVWINAESRLEYPSIFTDKERIVRLSGEAYFEVVSNEEHPFVVETGSIHTRALGTEFNVRNYAKENLSVTLVKGCVEVSNQDSQETALVHPNENLSLQEDGSFCLEKVDVATYISWKEGLFYFDNVSLDKIIYELGRWYDVNIRIADESLLKYKLHYYCKRADCLEEALQLLRDLGHFQVFFENQTIIIRLWSN